MIIKKGNRQLRIQESEKTFYLSQGYDVIDEKGKIVENATNKTVPISEYNKLKEELEKLKKEQAPKEQVKKESTK